MDRRKILVKYGKLLHEHNLAIGAGGNISEKYGNKLIIKKKGVNMSRCNINGYLSLSFRDAEGPLKEKLSSETPLHLACYLAREDIGAVIHVHSPFVVATSEKTDLLESNSYEFDCLLHKPVPVVDYIQPGSSLLANASAEKIKEGANAVILKRHGALSVGKDIEEAYLRILALERSCITYLFSQ